MKFPFVSVATATAAILVSGCSLTNGLTNKTAASFGASLLGARCLPGKSAKVAREVPVARTLAAAPSFATQASHLTMSREQLQSACTDGRAYVCTKAVFSPNVASGTVVYDECSTVTELGSPCLFVESMNFDTSGALAGAPAKSESMKPGGEFNHVEYTCYNAEIQDKTPGATLYPASSLQAVSLDEGLKSALGRCNALAEAVSEP